jgi:hypothetical protein
MRKLERPIARARRPEAKGASACWAPVRNRIENESLEIREAMTKATIAIAEHIHERVEHEDFVDLVDEGVDWWIRECGEPAFRASWLPGMREALREIVLDALSEAYGKPMKHD